MTKVFKLIAGFWLVSLLVACGGGGGDPGAPANGNIGGNTNTVTVADFQLGFNKNTLNNSGGDEVVVTVVALDGNNNVRPGATVQISVDSQAVYSSSSNVTDANGQTVGRITSPSNKANRIINVTARVGSVVKTGVLSVVGGEISVVPLPAAPNVGQAVSINLSLKDSGANGISGATLAIGGTFGASGSVVTDLNGNAVFDTVAPATAGTYTIVVSGFGLTTTKSVLVIGNAGGSGIPPATTLTNASLNSNVAQIRPNLSSSTANRAVITFRMIDNLNQAVSNIRVRFSIVQPGLGAGEAMSTGDSIVYTDGTGAARSDYIAGQRSSPTNGVQIRACYATTDAAFASNPCPNEKTATLTVSGTALNLSIFSNNVIEPVGVGNILYKKTFAVQVADSAGAPVPGAIVSAAVDITHYGKGVYQGGYARAVAPVATDTPATLNTVVVNGIPTTFSVPGEYSFVNNVTGVTETFNIRIWCKNEDLNRNGVLDANEDVDSDGALDPRVSDVIVLPIGSNVTDSSGNVTFIAQWGQNVGRWLAYTLKVTTNVGGSEGTNSSSFVTTFLQADEPNGSFRTPPYGSNACNVNN
jgi:hypothetical protein